MNIYEYQAKEILRKYNISTGHGIVILDKADIDKLIPQLQEGTYIVKAQIYAGGRGKAGGVKTAKNIKETQKYAHEIYGKTLITPQTGVKGEQVKRLYIEHGCRIAKEYYFSITIDRSLQRIVLIASAAGGVNIEEVAKSSPDKIIKIAVDPATSLTNFHCRYIAYRLGLEEKQVKQMIDIVKRIYQVFIETDALQIEINPLVVTTEGEIIALDAKFNFDDNALFRHPELAVLRNEDEGDSLEVRARKADLSYVRMDGTIGCMVNGAGLAMATMDIIKLYGANPANFLDVGGNATQERITEALKIIISDQNVRGILINIFGGIMRCDVIATGVVAAANEINLNIPLVVRLAGTNSSLGKKILTDSGLRIIAADDLGEAARKIIEAI